MPPPRCWRRWCRMQIAKWIHERLTGETDDDPSVYPLW
jgi:hypothetical protein